MAEDLTKYANAVGIVYDQSLPVRYPLGVAWQVDADTVVTCAHPVILYSDIVKALRVRFPTSGREFAVRSMVFHPGLDKAALTAMARRGFQDPVNALPLQKYNLAMLNLSHEDHELDADDIAEINKSFADFVPDSEGGLGGSLAEIELALVLQTITNARKEGTVFLYDERNRVVGQIFCSEGRVTHAYYHNLINELAIYQIILHRVAGSFSFKSGEEPDWTTVSEISRPLDMLLIEGLRRFDEMEKLASIVGGPSSLFQRAGEKPNLDVMPPETRETVKVLWPLLDGGTPLGLMWQLTGMDDYSIFLAMQELVKTRQLRYFEAGFVKEREVHTLPLGLDTPLAPNDIVTALWVEDPSLAPLLRKGALLGSVKQLDPSHVLHTVGLPFEAAGCPIFKDDKVIGIHCGAVPPEPSVVAPEGGFHQMIWVAAILDCLKLAGRDPLDKRRTLSGDVSEEKVLAAERQDGSGGCREVARVQCPKCGRTSLEMANFCKGCGQRLMRDADFKATGAVKKPAKVKAAATKTATKLAVIKPQAARSGPNFIALAVGLTLMAVGGGAAGIAGMPRPNLISANTVTVAKTPWFTRNIEEITPGGIVACADNHTFKGSTSFVIHLKVDQSGYMYVLVPQGDKVVLLAPSKDQDNKVLDPGDYLISYDGIARRAAGQAAVMHCDNKDDVERFLIVSSGRKLDLNSLSLKSKEFYDQAEKLLSCDETGRGVIVRYDDLGAGYFDQTELKNANRGLDGLRPDDVFISHLFVAHCEDKKAEAEKPGAAAGSSGASSGASSGTSSGSSGSSGASGASEASSGSVNSPTSAVTSPASDAGADATSGGAEASSETQSGTGAPPADSPSGNH